MNRRKRFATVLIVALLLCCMLPLQVLAAPAIDTDAKTSLDVTFTYGDAPVTGVRFHVYRVAEVTSSVRFIKLPAYQGVDVSLEEPTAETYRLLATSLPGVIVADKIQPTATAVTDETGVAHFVGLPTGLYLVRGERYHGSHVYVTPSDFMVALPDRTVEDTWNYDVNVTAKWTSEPDDNYVHLSVLKKWLDNDNPDRPEEIKVELYRDEVLYDEVTLSKKNNWQHYWNWLQAKYTWAVKEAEVPEGYQVSIERQYNRFVITNTSDTYEPPEDPLPRTGQLWWPVPVLLTAGLLLVVVGLTYRRGSEYEE